MKTVMLIDDDAGFCQALSLVFKRSGFNVMVETRGENVLANNFTRPDIFVLDRYLPDVDGLELCRHLKTRPETSEVPVVMISGTEDVKFHAPSAGAIDFLNKPVDVNHLLKIVNFHCTYGAPKSPNNKWRKHNISNN